MGENETCCWHDGKADLNLTNHGYDFADLAEAFDGRFAVVNQDGRRDYGEPRFNALVEFRGRIINIAFTPRAGKFQLISVRPASRAERQVYRVKSASR